MALFGKNDSAGGEISYAPDKAAKFFDHARTAHESTNYEYAMQMWLRGLNQDPRAMAGLEGFFGSAAAFLNEKNGKKASSRDTEKALDDARPDLKKYLLSLLEWGLKPTEAAYAVRAAELAANLKLEEPTFWIAQRAMKFVLASPKPRKDHLLKLRDAYMAAGKFDLALNAAEQALKLDPTDGPLAASIRSLAAQATMSRGGYDQAGQAGGFRANIRDSSKQRQLEEADRIVKTEDTVERLLATAKADHEARPDDLSALNVYIKRLLERGQPQDEETAHELLMKAFAASKQFRFRQTAGEIRVRQAKRRLTTLREAVEANPDDTIAQSILQTEAKTVVELEMQELKLRIEAYPTDLKLKHELGKRHFALEQFEEAIACFQEAQHDPSVRPAALNGLGQAFFRTGWMDEAIEIFRKALENLELSDDAAMELRYYLLCALQSKAENGRDRAAAEEAEKLASAIAIRQISYRDVRARREAIKTLLNDLRAPAR